MKTADKALSSDVPDGAGIAVNAVRTRNKSHMKYYIENFGCQMNDHDMEKVDRLLHVAGYEPVDASDHANVVIVNTCCVREKAEQKFYSFMGRLRGLKRKRGLVVGVMGCVAQLERDALFERLPFIDFSLGPSNVHRVTEAIEAAIRKDRLRDFSDNGCQSSLFVRPGNTTGKIKAYVSIMKGCNNFCSYCVVPYVRGREVSRPSTDILEEIEDLACTGIKEVVLLGQNVNSYNKGRDDLSFSDLLSRVNAVAGIERIRFVTSHPKDLSDSLIDCFGRLEKLCEQIHLPFQSGSDRILKAMNRGYTAQEYLEKVARLKSKCPDVTLTADCIVGFPGEEEEDFWATMDLVNQVRFDGVFSFCFSPRKFTQAATLDDAVPREVASERLQELQTIQKGITREQFQASEGKRQEVLVEGTSKNSADELTGRTRTNRIVNFVGTQQMIGKTVEVEIVKGYANSLRGADPKLKEA
jgi:tRNA-2-methylthio-N6-dimethylallyladenosine synthase